MIDRELRKISRILEKIGNFDLGAEVDSIREELIGNSFQGKMVQDLAEKGVLKKKPKFPKKPPPPPPEEMAPEEEGAPPGGEEEMPPEGGDEELPPEGDEAPPEGDEELPPVPASTQATVRIIATNVPNDREWLACNRPKRETIESGPAWTSVCVFVEKKSKKVGYMKRVVSKSDKRPQIVKMGKKTIKVVSDVHSIGKKVQKKLG